MLFLFLQILHFKFYCTALDSSQQKKQNKNCGWRTFFYVVLQNKPMNSIAWQRFKSNALGNFRVLCPGVRIQKCMCDIGRVQNPIRPSGSIIHELQRISQSSLRRSIWWYFHQTSGGSCAPSCYWTPPTLRFEVTCHMQPPPAPSLDGAPATDRRHHAATLQVETPTELNVSQRIHLFIYFVLFPDFKSDTEQPTNDK